MLAVWLFFWLGKLLSRQKKERTWTFMSRLFKDSDSSSFSPLPPSPFPVREHLAKLNKSSARPWRNALTGLCREAQRHKGKLWSSGHPQGGREVKRASTGGRLGEKGAPSCPVTLLFRGWNRGNLEAVLCWPEGQGGQIVIIGGHSGSRGCWAGTKHCGIVSWAGPLLYQLLSGWSLMSQSITLNFTLFGKEE